MNQNPHSDWRESLEPPAGGLARLVAAVEAQRAHRVGNWPRLALAGTALASLLAVVVGADLRRSAPERRIRAALTAAVQPAPNDEHMHVENGAALELPGGDSRVRMFWIAQLPTAAPTAPP
jgi:hypothetical protein